MSLVPTFVLMDDNKWYKNPSLGEKNWFICFDDDDPIELVIKEKDYKEGLTPDVIFAKIGAIAKVTSRPIRSGLRCFDSKFHFSGAVAFWIEIKNKPSVKFLRDHDGVSDKPPQQDCVFYDFKEIYRP